MKSENKVALKQTPRSLARSLAIQGLYYYQINKDSNTQDIEQYIKSASRVIYEKIDRAFFVFLLEHGVNQFDALLSQYEGLIDRDIKEFDCVTKAILVLAAVELFDNKTVHAVVIINESIDLAKLYCAPDAFKLINILVDRLSKKI